MKLELKIDPIRILAGITIVIMLLTFIFFSFRVIDAAQFWMITAVLAAFAYFGLPKLRKYYGK